MLCISEARHRRYLCSSLGCLPLPSATILFGLGAAALKAKSAASGGKDSEGPAGVAIEVGGELATVMLAHLATGHVERMQGRFAEWIGGNPIPEMSR
jgi:hypothetical protein